LNINDKVIPVGYIFIWVEKVIKITVTVVLLIAKQHSNNSQEYIPDVNEVLRKWGFFYVENLVWVTYPLIPDHLYDVNDSNHVPYLV